MFRIATKLGFRPSRIYPYHPDVHRPCRLISTTPKKQITNHKYYRAAYSKVSMDEAEKILGCMFEKFESLAIPMRQMLAHAKPQIEGTGNHQVQKTKQMVYDNIVRYIECEGYPTEANEDFNEANVNDLVLLVILPILTELKHETGQKLYLRREKETVAVEGERGDFHEFVRMDFVGVGDRKFVLVVEAMESSVGQAKRQCLLALKDMGDNNDGGVVYGFLTSGGQWQMIRYDSMGFTQTVRLEILFGGMEHDKERWMKKCSVIVDCIYMALRSGRFVAM